LAEAGEIWDDAEPLLCTAVSDAKPGDDLVEDQQSLMFVGEMSKPLQEAVFGRDDTEDWLDDDRGDLVLVLLEKVPYALKIVELGNKHSFGDAGWNPG